MTYFLKSGTRFNVTTKESMDLHEILPAGNYTVKFDKMSGSFYLEAIDSFEIKGKIYGDSRRSAERILNTFNDRTSSTGIMLTGEKGSGKTLLAKMLSIMGAEAGVPTIVINAPWCGDEFNAFLQMIEQPTIILFDEFEKVYDGEDQEKMLTLLDGVYPSKKLFILTCNDKWRINDHMRNRPGRIYYMMEYKGLDQDFIVEYCNDNLKDLNQVPSVCRVSTLFDQFNFDMLKAMVEEMNRYGETAQQVMKMLNTRPEFGGETRYKVVLQPKGIEIDEKLLEQNEWHGNPLTQNVSLDYKVYEDISDKDSDYDWENCRFTNADLKQVDAQKGQFIFINDEGDRAVLAKIKDRGYHWDAF
jgi:SpoVK/Ycf46/Vps4 family AAA+-type ATPase